MTSRGFRISRCARCRLPQENCICEHLNAVPNQIQVALLRHPKEAHRTSGTAELLLQCLQNVVLLDPTTVNAFLDASAGKSIALLYPPDGEEALTNAPTTQHCLEQTQVLIVPDGTWVQTRKMVRKNPRLKSLHRVSPLLQERWLVHPLRLDKWERPCTAEACGQWLADAGDTVAATQIRTVLQIFVDAHWKARGGLQRPIMITAQD